MADIKLRRVAKKRIKTIDKSAVVAERMKDAYARTKSRAEQGVYSAESSTDEYAADRYAHGVESVVHETFNQLDQQGRKGLRIAKAKVPEAQRTVKSTQKAVKTTERSGKAVVKTARQTTKNAQKIAQTSARAAKESAQTARAVAQAITRAVKSAIEGTKSLIAVIAAGGWVAVLIIVIICMIGMLCGSVYGIFFTGEDTDDMTVRSVMQETELDYYARIEFIKTVYLYDTITVHDSGIDWTEVLAVYAVKTTNDPDNPQEVASMDFLKKAALQQVFWDMNVISTHTEYTTETETMVFTDIFGNEIEIPYTVIKAHLHVTVTHRTADEMADRYYFDEDEREQLEELLADENTTMWNEVIWG